MNYDDLLRELKMKAVSFPDISAEDLSNIIHALENHFYKAINDVEPGRHGRWINHLREDGATDGIFCSQCNYETDRDSRPSYCPNCGAKMISEVNIRETVKAALKAAGWSDDTINTFLNPDIEVVNPVPMSTYITNAFSDEVDAINLPQRMDSTSLTITHAKASEVAIKAMGLSRPVPKYHERIQNDTRVGKEQLDYFKDQGFDILQKSIDHARMGLLEAMLGKIEFGKDYVIRGEKRQEEDVSRDQIVIQQGIQIDELVRCKDCKHFVDERFCALGMLSRNSLSPSDYCSYGERRKDE